LKYAVDIPRIDDLRAPLARHAQVDDAGARGWQRRGWHVSRRPRSPGFTIDAQGAQLQWVRACARNR